MLPIYVSKKAYVREQCWLKLGSELMKEELGHEKDYLLPLADESLQGCVERRAEYSDAIYYSRNLLGMLTTRESLRAEAQALLGETAVKHWTEHSDRAGLSSWLAGTGVAKSVRSFLGRWAVRGSADQSRWTT